MLDKQKRKACLISCSDHYNHRLYVIDGVLRQKGYESVYITSDFDHTPKKKFVCQIPGCVQIPVREYQKNLSADRILSHREFARDAFAHIDSMEQEPDIIIVLLPPNFLAHYAARYKRKHPNVKLVFDIFDMWPETFPYGKLKKLLAPAFFVWSSIRDCNLGAADFVISECELFRKKLKLSDSSSQTVYLCAKDHGIPATEPRLRDDRFDFCYLGAINNVISIADICALIADAVRIKPVVLHIVGKGEREQEFADAAKNAGAQVMFYGAIYDNAKKREIMDQCHFGLNIMKSSVCVGLTMKSIDYFSHGLPIINNIPEDTRRLVEEEKIGLQLDGDCAGKLGQITVQECLQMRKNVKALFESRFSEEVVVGEYEKIVSDLEK